MESANPIWLGIGILCVIGVIVLYHLWMDRSARKRAKAATPESASSAEKATKGPEGSS